MRRFYKVLSVLLVLIALIAATALVAVRFLPESDLIRNNVQEKLGALIGHEVVLGALKISASFPSLIHLSFEGISVNSPRGKRILSADKVVLSPALRPLLNREVSVESITVQGLRLSVDHIREGEDKETSEPASRLAAQKQTQGDGGVDAPPTGATQAAGPEERPAEKAGTFRWSVNKVKVVDARIDWADRQIVPGREVVVSLNGLDGSLIRRNEGNSFAVNLAALISVDKANSGAVKIGGTITANSDLSRVIGGQIDLSGESLELKPFHALLPASTPLFREFDSAVVGGRFSWEDAQRPRITCKLDLKAANKGHAQVGLQAELVAAEDLSSVEEIRGTAETASLPLSFIRAHLPAQIPLDPSQGVVKGSLKGEWTTGKDWLVGGALGVEDAAPTGSIKGIAKHLRLWAHIKVNPQLLLLENMEVFGATRLASIGGKVTKPFSPNPGIDLKGEVAVEPHWLKGFGIQIPKTLEIGGVIPVRGLVRGDADQLWMDLTGDLTGTSIKWNQSFRKEPGKKATLSFKGKFLPSRDGKVRQQKPEALIRLSMAGVNLRLTPKAPWMSGAVVQLDSRVLTNGSAFDFKDAVLAVRRGSEAGDLLTAKASANGVGSASPRIEANGTVVLDKRLLDLGGIETPAGVAVSGSAPLKVSFSGFPPNLDWTAEVPLTHLDITIQQAFRKPGGVNGSLSASGKFVGDELLLTNGRLTMPGLHVAASGMLRDAAGNFRGITLNVKKTELKDVARLVPAAAGMGLSGPIEAALSIKPIQKGAAPAGTIRLLGVDYRPDKAGWAVEKMKGTIELDGTSVEVPDLTGNLSGAVEGPLKLKGALNGIGSVESLNGRVSAYVGQGRIKADRLRGILDQTRLLVGTLINPQSPDKAKDPLEFQSLAGDFQIASGTARTDNLTLKGPNLGCGVIGSLRLTSMDLDALVGIHTVTVVGDALGKIPAVKQFVKKHEGLLAATGLDKELKRIGIDVGDTKEAKPGQPPQVVKTPVTMILKLKGPASSPNVAPVLETAVEKGTLTRLKSLMN
ncbi:MAG: DUF748 domain-containing protein [Desulfomonile tiedjei]|nr:DUF748 domain-containing protein [Desulfomonile tiedjei]